MNCPNCQEQTNEASKFCGFCGSPIKLQLTNDIGHKQYVLMNKPPRTLRLAGFLVIIDVLLEYLKLYLVARPYQDWSYHGIKTYPNEFIYEDSSFTVISILFSLFIVGFIGIFILKGKNWAKISFLIILPLCIFRFLLFHSEILTYLEGFQFLSIVQTLSYLIIIYLLFKKESRNWYKRISNSK